MTNNKLKKLVAEAVSLDRQQQTITARLAEIEDQLVAEAGTRPDEHTPTDGGGWSWIADGGDDGVARVTKTGPTLKASITTDKDVQRAKEVCGPIFNTLFDVKLSYKLATAFRDQSAQLLGAAASAKLIKAFSTAGRTRISYETKEVA